MCDTPELIERVQQSLNRLGYTQLDAQDLGGGRVLLCGRVRSFDERAIVVATVRTVSGVTSVSLKVKT